jgi:hypothetical protein
MLTMIFLPGTFVAVSPEHSLYRSASDLASLGLFCNAIFQLGSCIGVGCEYEILDLLGSYNTYYCSSLWVLEGLVQL